MVEWNGKPVKAIEKAFHERSSGRWSWPGRDSSRAEAHRCDVVDAERNESVEAAGFVGMSLEMPLERYGHHHPDHLAGARKAFAKPRETVAEKGSKIS